MHGELGTKLVQHAKRTQSLVHMPPYQTELVRAITREVRELDKDVQSTLASYGEVSGGFDPASDPATACALLVNHLAMRRNKRCLLAYHRVRAAKLEELCWSGVDVLESLQPDQNESTTMTAVDTSATSSFSPEEEEYARKYSELLASCKGQWTDIDLTGSLDPPKDLFIDVRVLRDAGEIQTEYGSITLSKNSQFYVRQKDVSRLISQGYLEKLG